MAEPLDIKSIRASVPAQMLENQWTAPNLIRALCDELEATRAERDASPDYVEWQELRLIAEQGQARAERAEAALASENTMHLRTMQELREAEAALVRASTMCSRPDGVCLKKVWGDD